MAATIVNGLFAGRSGLNSHGAALAIVGDNIANVNTVGHKAARPEFKDLIAGSSSGVASFIGAEVSTAPQIFEQGTLEATGRALDIGIDGNGYFVVSDGSARTYTRAGNFTVNTDGEITNQDGLTLLGFPANGTGTLQSLNVNSISQDSVDTANIDISGNLDARSTILTNGAADIPAVSVAGAAATSTTTYADLSSIAEFSTSIDVFDTQGGTHTITVFFFHTDTNEYTARSYVNSEDVDATGTATGLPRLLTNGTTGDITLSFTADGTRDPAPGPLESDLTLNVPWNNGSDNTQTVDLTLSPFTQFSSSSSTLSIAQDGRGVGNIASISITQDGVVSSVLSNGQQAVIGTIALADFANPEALTRLGGQIYQRSSASGEPVIGKPQTGTLGVVEAETLELSTVDIADQFVKLITYQRGFQANSRIITTVNELLSAIIQLAN